MVLSQLQIEIIARKIAEYTKGSKFSNDLVIGKIITLLIEQNPSYQQFEYLGKGQSTLVLKVKTNDSEYVALKIVEFDQSNQKAIEAIQREYGIVKSLQNNEYIIKLNRSFLLAKEEEEKYEEEFIDINELEEEGKSEKLENTNAINSYFVQETELCQGNLAEYLDFLRNKNIVLEERMKIIMVVQMLDAINYLHQRDIVHRDIKPQNFLYVEKEGFIILKLCDFGYASSFEKNDSLSYLSGRGTRGYTAPEVNKGQSRKESDLYSLGIIIVEIDNSPTFNYSEVTLGEQEILQQGQGIFPKHNLNNSSILFQIASTLLQPNFRERSSAKQILLDLLKQQHLILKNIPIYSIILGGQLSLLPFSIPQLNNKKAKQIQELKSISMSLPSSEVTTKKKIDALLHSYSNQDNQNALTQLQAEGALRALFKKGNYDNFEILGAGSAGLIVGGMNLRYQRQSALKICLCQNKAYIFRQIDILNKCQMPRIVKFYGYQFIKDDNNTEYVVFEMERCRCTLTQYLDEQCLNNKPYSPQQKINMSIQMIDGVNFLHELEIIHRDIKLDNFLILEQEKGEIEVKLADFDQAAQLEENFEWQLKYENHENELLPPYNCAIIRDKLGTFPYYAPEMFDALFPTTKKTDMYSLGLCLLVLDNYLSFSENELIKKKSALMNPYLEPFLEQKEIIIDRTSQIYNIARKLLAYLPNNRIKLSKILVDSNSLLQTYSRQIEFPFSQKNIQKIYYFKMIPTKQMVEFKQIIDYVSIMKSLSHLSLNLWRNSIGESGAEYISTGLSKLTNLSILSLNLNSNSIGASGANYVSAALSKLTNLSHLGLYLSENIIGESGANYISTALTNLTNLISLSLNLSFSSIKVSGANYLSTALSKLTNLSSLSLYLRSDSIEESGAKFLSAALSKLTSLSSLCLYLTANSIGHSGTNYLSTGLSKLTQLSNLSLQLSGNSIGEQGAYYLSTALSNLTNLSSLSLNFSNDSIKESGANHLSKALSKLIHLSSLSLDFRNNQIEEQGARYVSEALLNLTNLSSLSLNLFCNYIEEQGLKYVSITLSKMDYLSSLSLDLSFHPIEQSGDSYLSKELSKLTNLSNLSLIFTCNKMGDQIAKSLLLALSFLTNLSYLSLDFTMNLLSELSAQQLKMALSELTNLSYLSLILSFNSINESGANFISNALSNLTNLSSLNFDLEGNSIGEKGVKHVSTALSKLKNLSTLYLNLQHTSIEELGAYYVSKALSNLTNLFRLQINLSQNSIEEQGAQEVSTALSKLTNLSSLFLNLNDISIVQSGAVHLSTVLSKFTHLFVLDLNLGDNIIANSGVELVSMALSNLTNLRSLKLNFQDNAIRDYGASILGTALSNLTNLEMFNLDLGDNIILAHGAIYVSTGLSKLTNLSSLSLNFRGNLIGEPGANSLSTALSNLTNLSELSLFLQDNDLGEIGANHISMALSNLTHLSRLCLDIKWNLIGEQGANYVSAALQKLTSLSALTLDFSEKPIIEESGTKYF